jgi:putative hemolysin
MQISKKHGLRGIRVEHNKTLFWIIIFLLIILIGIALAIIKLQDNAKNSNPQLANPASVYCIEKGGNLSIRQDESGGQYGVCKINGTECEEWAFFRGECR